MGLLWVILFSASTGLLLIQGLPVRPTPQVYPHGTNEAAVLEGWRPQGLYTLPVLALVVTALGLLFGCTWCYRHKDCKMCRANDMMVSSYENEHDRRSGQPMAMNFTTIVLISKRQVVSRPGDPVSVCVRLFRTDAPVCTQSADGAGSANCDSIAPHVDLSYHCPFMSPW
ncbi:hypothetical protein RR46_09827 [Papilio xuthus]|uniref:Uncharacterized protein n=1 Tax=Papilio xuthus TaxID=66420 RepID=A0A194QB18_PAPXU|nr:hypothetical protein RR46_09827 [Papilio xuthus]